MRFLRQPPVQTQVVLRRENCTKTMNTVPLKDVEKLVYALEELLCIAKMHASGVSLDLAEDTLASWYSAHPKAEENINLKPPIGVKPEWLWREERMWDLLKCLYRHSEAQRSFNTEWLEELRTRIGEVLNHQNYNP